MANEHRWELKNFLPENPEDILALTLDELAECILVYIAAKPPEEGKSIASFSFGLYDSRNKLPYADHRDAIGDVLAEGWAWLVRECLLIPDLQSHGGGDFILSRRGKQLAESGDFKSFRAERMLPRELLHPTIADTVLSDFLRGDYESAVFKACREVEIAVREKGGYSTSEYGVPLMRKAFDPQKGPLRDRDAEAGEREAMPQLFAGAIGLYKNPSSHRRPEMSDPTAVIEILMIASHLLRIVGERAANVPEEADRQ